MRSIRLLIIATVLVASALASSFAGTFEDRDGVSHTWSIDSAHVLVWEGTPYIPFGTIFEPKYLSAGQTEENWAADEEDVAAFKMAGVTDVILRAGKGITLAPVEAFQRIIDLLETNELRYGIELYNPPYAPLFGYVIRPDINRADEADDSGEYTRTFPQARSALYALCDAKTAEVEDFGRAEALNGQVTARVVARTEADHVLLFYPQKVIAEEDEDWGLPDLWADFDRQRDGLVQYLAQIKFGSGLRFFIDPFTEDIGVSGDSDALIPTSAPFRLEYAAWLSRKYGTLREITMSWGVLKHDIGSFEEAARLIPLWRSGRGVPTVYDDGTRRTYSVDTIKSAIWEDFLAFRDHSVGVYLNAMADVLKRAVADVPVTYTANGLKSFYQATGSTGFDGLAVPASADARTATVLSGQAFSLADSSSRRIWIIAKIGPSGGVYDQKGDLFSAVNARRDLGVKGFFAEDSTATGVKGADLLSWLVEYASLSAADRYFANYRPQVIYYPQDVAHTSIKQLPSGAWWLPALVSGRDLYLGSDFGGYAFTDPRTGEASIYVWSRNGVRDMRVVAYTSVTVTDMSGTTTEIKPRKDRVKLTVGEEPISVRGIPAESFLPVEVVEEAIRELENTIVRAEKLKVDTGSYKSSLRDAKKLMDDNQLSTSWSIAMTMVNELNLRLRGLTIGVGTSRPANEVLERK